MNQRGYWGVAICNGKTPQNAGGIWRSVACFGGDFIASVGVQRYPRGLVPEDNRDPQKAIRHVPLFQFWSIPELVQAIPLVRVIGVEICDRARPIETFCHPERAVYVVGPEDGSIPRNELAHCDDVIVIPSGCLNQASAATVVMYDRIAKAARAEPVRLVSLAEPDVSEGSVALADVVRGGR